MTQQARGGRTPEPTVRVLAEVFALLGGGREREALEALLSHLVRTGRVSAARAGERLGLGGTEAARRYASRGHPFPDDAEAKGTEEAFRRADPMDLIGEIETAKILGDEEAVATIRAAMAGEARGVPDSSDQWGGEGS